VQQPALRVRSRLALSIDARLAQAIAVKGGYRGVQLGQRSVQQELMLRTRQPGRLPQIGSARPESGYVSICRRNYRGLCHGLVRTIGIHPADKRNGRS